MAEPITQARLRALSAVHPQQGRVLSVFLNLDPTSFATPAARSSAITSVITAAAHKVDESEGLTHDERLGLRDDVERVREVLEGSDIAQNGTRAVAVYACGSEGLLDVIKLRRPVDNKVVLDRTAFVEPLVVQGTDERWMVLLVNRRAARLFFGPGDALEETDRLVDDVHQQHGKGGWSQSNYQRSVDKEVSDHLQNAADLAFKLYKTQGADRVLVGVPGELLTELKSKLHPYLIERAAGKINVDVENASLDDVCAAARPEITAHNMRSEREVLDRLQQGVGAGGRGAAGIEEVLDALNQARVETLLISENFRASGRVDFQAGLLLPDNAEGGEPVADIVEPAIEKAIEQSASALVVRHHTDLEPMGGIGALLRF
ncbi:Vms1/Ankzf1 family peptidyl-tRNA hydrolase [Solirubrobacter phytolaccae]|uniref:Vms1/Ankzf1 family peptidyl-tRNA hydrolase n=1 Tax=Solirubrobacter phytolaccae TaxID=1404360 RepID=A0A9X3S6F5_9ACTN|nr:Vms1/Ankzf1 family peptidyl-tRNA hydrolase [Solirubrobacter phytolaccae]MDA0179043.1 Vms1/Ankzf1 family peptidyl-tRNA hydrolase [Solirubrobacter phytolaccae]